MFQAIKDWVVNNQRASYIIGLSFVGAVAILLASGAFDVGVSQFFAFQCNDDSECASGQYCSDGGSCISDDGSPGSTPSESCNPVTGTGWNSAASPQCTPFPIPPAISPPPIPPNYFDHLDVTGGSLPVQFQSCLGFTIGNDGWKAIDARQGASAPPPAGKAVVSGTVFNNCPWEVEMSLGAAGSPKQGNDFIFMVGGAKDDPWFGAESMMERVTPTVRIPSCFNYPHISGGTPKTGCTVPFEAAINVSNANAGRVEASLGWRHYNGTGERGVVQDGYNIVINYGTDCAGRIGERCATDVGGGSGNGGSGSGGTTGITGSGPGGAFNCGTGSGSDACWCGEWTDAIWAQRHVVAACNCDPNFVIDASLAVGGFSAAEQPATIGKTCNDYSNWSRSAVQAFIDVMEENFTGGNQSCQPRSGGVDYAGIQEKYFSVSDIGWGLSGNGSGAVAQLCKDASGTEAAVLEATCGTGPSIQLSWNIPTNSVTNALLKRVDADQGQFIETGIGRFATNYTDLAVQAGHTYHYQHKSHASVASNTITVEIDANGTCTVPGGASPSPTTIVSSPTPLGTPATTVIPTATPPPVIVFVTPPPPPPSGCNDTDRDGVCDEDECPTANQGFCIDTDGDGQPDFDDDDGPGVVSTAGTTQTGPGEATLLAFILASVTALLYVSYTHTSLFRRREVQKVQGDKDIMDFRQ